MPSPAICTTSRSPPAAPTSSSTKTAPTSTDTSHHPGLISPLRQASLTPRDGRPKVLQPPAEPPRLCTQTAITIAPDIGARYRQDLPYGSPAWHRPYATLRNTIEGLNGLIKNPAHQAPRHPAR